ncbi:MAG: hypothetical protein K9M97_02755 [Akkermansiaceae bacterium]|nr:hypothetical protein [Akkermansiaceae bacterium]
MKDDIIRSNKAARGAGWIEPKERGGVMEKLLNRENGRFAGLAKNKMQKIFQQTFNWLCRTSFANQKRP